MSETGALKIPKFQRTTEGARRLIQSLMSCAKTGSLLGSFVLWLDSKGIYWVLDARTRLNILLTKKFPLGCQVPVTIIKDITYEQARDIYTELNRTAVRQSTGELVHGYEKDFPQSLKNFLKDPVWGMYEKRFKYLELGVKLYFEAIGKGAYDCDAIIERLTPEEQGDDSLIDTHVLDNVLSDVAKCQSVLARAVSALSDVEAHTWWPVMWLFRALQYEPSLRRQTVQSLTDGFVAWKKSRTGKLDTSQPNRPKSDLDQNMQDLVDYLKG
jgi:hypothetical protein